MQGIDEYKISNSILRLDELVRDHATLVLKIAKKIKRKLPSNIELDDLVQAGFVGLIEASKTFCEGQGASFETFASIRVKGSILDELRKNSLNNRDILKSIREMGQAVHKIEQRTQGAATAEAVATELKISMEEYDRICQYIHINNMASLDMLTDADSIAAETPSPEQHALQEDAIGLMKKILHTLPEREQIILSLYYLEELTFREISEVLDITEARVCQLHASIIAKISRKMENS